MNNVHLAILAGSLISQATFAAHIATETRTGSEPVSRTDTYANSAGDLRIEERSYGSSASISDSASSSISNSSYTLGKTQDVMLFQSKDRAIVVLEGKSCRRMTADSATQVSSGMPGMNMGEANAQMAAAMQQANTAMEQAMAQARKQGMSPDQLRALEQFAKPMTQPTQIKPADTLEIYALDKKARVGNFSAEGYGVRNAAGNDKHRIWVVDAKDIPGGKKVRNAMRGMIETYADFLDNMGGGSLMDTGLTAMFNKPALADKYPVRIEDLDSGEVTDVVEANEDASAEFYPDCDIKDMLGR